MRKALVVLLCVACKRAPERYCPQDFSGVWLNASDHHYAYRFRDHGDVVRGEYLARSDAGALSPPADAALFELHRTKEALAGVMKMDLALPSGRRCPAQFGFKVSSCSADAFSAVVETSADYNEDCTRKDAEPRLVEFRFEREHPPDAGSGRR